MMTLSQDDGTGVKLLLLFLQPSEMGTIPWIWVCDTCLKNLGVRSCGYRPEAVRWEEGAVLHQDLAAQPQGVGKAGPSAGHGERASVEPSHDGHWIPRCRGRKSKQAAGHLVTLWEAETI